MSAFRSAMDRLAQRFRATPRPLPPFYIYGKHYNPFSGGVRALHLLCHYLTDAGLEAYLVHPRDRRLTTNPSLKTPVLTPAVRATHESEGRGRIAVYSQGVAGNPLEGTTVIRYLLNTPGLLAPEAPGTYGPDDIFLTFAPEHSIGGTPSFDLFLPLVDRSLHFPPPAGSRREGFVVLGIHDPPPNPETFPSWLAPWRLITRAAPIPPAELAELHRRSRAMVMLERSTAIYEAEMCGCPVICIPHEHFREETYQPRFKGLGQVWGWEEERLAAAADETAGFRAIYDEIESGVGDRMKAAIAWIVDQERQQSRRGP